MSPYAELSLLSPLFRIWIAGSFSLYLNVSAFAVLYRF